MRHSSRLVLGLMAVLTLSAPGLAQDSRPGSASPVTPCPASPTCDCHGSGAGCCRWTAGCFPLHGCPDDYCPNPFPRQCWPPYPPFYRCVPAGNCGHPPCVGVGNETLTWWWIPTPRALREALWCRP